MRALIVLLALAGAAHAAEDPHAGHQMPAQPAVTPSPDPHAGHTMASTPAPDPHAGHRMPAADGTEPAAPLDFAADAIFGAAAMASARHALHHEHGAHILSKVMVDELEFTTGRGADGYRWNAEARVGGDIDRAVVKSEGEGSGELEQAEVQLLYSHAVGPYFDLQAGVRHDFRPTPSRSYAVVGIEGLAPYWFDVTAAAFLSDKGDLLARAEASLDQLLTQRLVIQPRAEVNVAAQDMAAQGIGRGIATIDLGIRLRAEIRREFAPYIGVSYERKIGRTADFARAAGGNAGGVRLVAGLRTWF